MQSTNVVLAAAAGLIPLALVVVWMGDEPLAQSGDSVHSVEVAALADASKTTERESAENETSGGVTSDAVSPTADRRNAATFPVEIRRPDGPPVVTLAGADPLQREARVACSTCHDVRPPNLKNEPALLNEFHQGLQVSHGKLACYSCHNPSDADSLRLADGSRVAYRDVMTMCAQCHSSQATAFAHGAHGGMRGHWDLSQGGQEKNNCVDCHDPHSPSFPRMQVTFKPRDRFHEPEASHGEHE